MKDSQTLQVALADQNPFKSGATLKNLMNAINLDNNLDVDNAKIIGEKIMQISQSVVHYTCTFKCKDQATTLYAKSFVRISNDQPHVDLVQLFHPLIVAPKSAESMFRFELWPHSPSILDDSHMLQEGASPKTFTTGFKHSSLGLWMHHQNWWRL